MWIKDNNGRWIQKETVLNSDEFERSLTRLKTYSKCLNASTYSVTNNLDNIYSEILYQHGFYIEFLDSAPDKMYISDILLQKNKMYNLTITHSEDVIINNKLDYIVTENENLNILSMTIRTAIALNYIKVANSLLFENSCGLTYWNDYISNDIFYNDNPDPNCYSIAGTNGSYNATTIYDIRNNFLHDYNINVELSNNECIFKYQNFEYLNNLNLDNLYFIIFNNITKLPKNATINPTGNSNPFQIINSVSKTELIDSNILESIISSMQTGDFIMFIGPNNLNPEQWNIDNISELSKVGVKSTELLNTVNSFIFIGQKDSIVGSYDIFFNTNSILRIGLDDITTYGTSGTSGNDNLIPIFDTTLLFLDEGYTKSDVYDVWNDNEDNLEYSLETYWTPERTITNLLNNFRLIDVASTTNVDIYNKWFELIIDGVYVEETMLVLLKDQDNKLENGIYLYNNKMLQLSNIFDDIKDREYFSVYIKVGDINKYKQFFIERYPNGDYYAGTNGEINFIEAKNYVIRNRVDYKLLNDNTYNDSVLHIDKNPILYDYEKFDLSVETNNYSYKVSDDLNWIIRKEDNYLIGQFNLFGTSGTSGEFLPLNLCFRLQSFDDNIYYVNYEDTFSKIYRLDTITNESFLYFELENYIIKDFRFENDILYVLVLDSDNNEGFKLYNQTNLQYITSYDINLNIKEFDVLTIYNVTWYFLLTETTIYQWNPDLGLDVISEEHAKYLIAHLDLRSINNEITLNNILEPIIDPESTQYAQFGRSIATDSNKLIISAPLYNDTGKVYLYDINDLENIIQDVEGSTDGLFGSSLAIKNNIVVIGEPGWSNRIGRVIIYDITNDIFTQIAELKPSQFQINTLFGNNVLITSTEIIISAENEYDSGAVYVYDINDLSVPKQILEVNNHPQNYSFGTSIHTNENYLVVGAPYANNYGKVYLYEKSSVTNQWELINELHSKHTTTNDLFGSTVLITDTYLFISASNYQEYDSVLGGISVFRNMGYNNWEEIDTMIVLKNSIYNNFGVSMYYDNINKMLYISAPYKQGVVVEFKEVSYNKWIQQRLIESPSPSLTGLFGYDISGDDKNIFIGQPNTGYTGSVYPYEVDTILEGTDGTNGLSDDYVLISYIRQQDKFPVRLEKSVNNITDYLNWQNSDELYIYDNYSKTELGDWKIENCTLYLKDVNILGLSTSGADVIPKISNLEGRYFDGKDDYVQLPELMFDNVNNISIEFTINPTAIKVDSRVFYFGSEKIDDTSLLYDSVEFIIKDSLTNKPKFQIKNNNDYLIIDSDEPLETNIETRVTITLEFSNSLDVNQPYYYNGRVWFNDKLVGSSSNKFTKIISELNPLTNNYFAKTSDYTNPLYSGEIKEFRISNIVLNPAQIAVRYIPIVLTDVTYNNLLYYWDLLDETSIIQDKILFSNGNFIGGLFTDETLQEIQNPVQILYSTDTKYLYILTQESFGTSNEQLSKIFKITFQTEDVDLVLETTNIISIYIESNKLYWLSNNKIYSNDSLNSIVDLTNNAVDFCVVNNKVFYIDDFNNIYDETNRLVFDASSYTNNINLELIYGYYQTGETDYYIVYLKDISGIIYILSSSFNAFLSLLELYGTYPFYLNNHNNVTKGIILDNNEYYITNDNKVIKIFNNIEIDLDLKSQYWSWNVKKIFGISGFDTTLFIGTVNNNNEVQIWRHDTINNRTTLVRRDINGYIFTSDTLSLDLSVVNDSEPRLFIIKEDLSSVNIINVDKNSSAFKTYDTVISYPTNTSLYELSTIDEQTYLYVNIQDSKKYIGKYFNDIKYEFWNNVLTTNDTIYKLWVGDFGVALKNVDNSIINGHTLELLQTYVKFNFNNIELGIDKNLNEYNYIIPTWNGNAWISGENGNQIKSINFGESWDIVTTNTYNELNSTNYLNNTGLVVGTNETILESISNGHFYNKVLIPDNLINNRELSDVLIYDDKYALIVGKSGLILHLELINNSWVLNRNILNETIDIVTTDDLEYIIKPIMYIDDDKTLLKTNYSVIKYIDNTFWLFGDKGYITKLSLEYTNLYVKPIFEFYNDPTYIDQILSVNEFIDYNDGLNKFLLTSNNNTKLFTIYGSKNTENSNYYLIELEDLHFNNSFEYKTSLIENNETIYLSGYNGNITKGDLQDITNLDRYFNITLEEYDSILYEYFIPKMLITDYYLARKINILLRDKNYIIPTSKVPKNILSCVNNIYPVFNEDEYVEFTTVSDLGQTNYLAYQDWMYTTRRLMLLEGINNDGKTKYYPYNKQFVAKNDVSNYTWEKINTIPNDGFVHVENPLNNDNINTIIRNEIWTDNHLFPERYYHTVIYVDSSFIVNANDVIEVKLSRQELGTNGLEYTKLLLKEPFIVQAVENLGTSNKIILWSLLDPEVLVDFEPVSNTYKSWTIRLENLNYFDGHLNDLQNKISRHLIGKVYDIDINEKDYIIVNAKVDKNTKYFNLETQLKFYTSGELTNPELQIFNVKYLDNIIYGPNYNLYKFLNRIDPIFTLDYEFGKVEFNGTLALTQDEYELDLSRNYLYAGEWWFSHDKNDNNVSLLSDFKEGTWIDIEKGLDIVKRVYIDKIETYLDQNNRNVMKITFDTNLEDVFFGNTNNVLKLKSRYKLSEISLDLNWTDNINIPTPATDGEFNTSGEYEITEQLGSYYHGWHNYVRTATAYAEIVTHDINVRKNISAIVWIDNNNDLKLNIFNWNNDPNFAFRPLDLHVVGIDAAEDDLFDYYSDLNHDGVTEYVGSSEKIYGLKKAISVLNTNWNINDNIFGLKDVDLNKYNFILTDGLTLQRLNEEFYWVLNADIRDAVIGLETIDNIEYFKWYKGTWLCGVWEYGYWYSGEVYNIKWINGEWYSHEAINEFNKWNINKTINDSILSIWYNGEWGNGTWHNGVWYNGIWYNGNHLLGNWTDGIWYNGVWENGNWSGGSYYGGTWLDGIWNNDNVDSMWYNGSWFGGDFENGIWINGIWDQAANKISRFGTKSNLVQKAIWQFGLWKNGEFHNYLNVDENNITIASKNYNSSFWYNGLWISGEWYGGTWFHGTWYNGIWYNGLWKSNLNLKYIERVELNEDHNQEDRIQARLYFEDMHYYNVTTQHLDFNNQTPENISNLRVNKLIIFGEPKVEQGELPVIAPQIGWNSFPVDHTVEIVDDYTLILKTFNNDKYDNTYINAPLIELGGTNGTSGTNGIMPELCSDENIEIIPEPIVDIYDTFTTYTNGPSVVSHWLDGTWHTGIWENGYWSNGRWLGGVWLDGVWERGVFGK